MIVAVGSNYVLENFFQRPFLDRVYINFVFVTTILVIIVVYMRYATSHCDTVRDVKGLRLRSEVT